MDLLKLIEDFAVAWNRHDCEALLSMVTDDCVFETAVGDYYYGNRFNGKEQLRSAFPLVWQTYPDARWEEVTHVVCGERGFSEWTFRGTDRLGKSFEVRGVDLFVFRDGRIARKDTFRKNVVVSSQREM